MWYSLLVSKVSQGFEDEWSSWVHHETQVLLFLEVLLGIDQILRQLLFHNQFWLAYQTGSSLCQTFFGDTWTKDVSGFWITDLKLLITSV